MRIQTLIVVIIVLIGVGGIAGSLYYSYNTLSIPSSAMPPTSPYYLSYYPNHTTYHGNVTKVLLLDSKLKYGVYDRDWYFSLCGPVKKGEPCVIITVTIRNDYTEEWPNGYFISLTAYLYNKEGKRVGTVMTPNNMHCGYAETSLNNGETGSLDIYVYYNRQDIDHYELYVNNIQDLATP